MNTTLKTKKTYEKPTLTQVKLMPEEAVLGGCKTPTTDAAFGNALNCNIGTCLEDGS